MPIIYIIHKIVSKIFELLTGLYHRKSVEFEKTRDHLTDDMTLPKANICPDCNPNEPLLTFIKI